MLDFFVAPRVTGNNGDPQHIGTGRLDQGEDGLRVGAAGSGAIFVDDQFALFLRGQGRRGHYHENQKRQESA